MFHILIRLPCCIFRIILPVYPIFHFSRFVESLLWNFLHYMLLRLRRTEDGFYLVAIWWNYLRKLVCNYCSFLLLLVLAAISEKLTNLKGGKSKTKDMLCMDWCWKWFEPANYNMYTILATFLFLTKLFYITIYGPMRPPNLTVHFWKSTFSSLWGHYSNFTLKMSKLADSKFSKLHCSVL